jgi:acyl-CoA hydrolase
MVTSTNAPFSGCQSASPVFPALANHYGTLFAGEALNLMARAAVMTAADRAGGDAVMAGCDGVAFHAPIPVGQVLYLNAQVVRTGKSSMTIKVTGEAGALGRPERRAVLEGLFHMVAVDADGRPTPLPCLERTSSREVA